jgi:Alg9-like mannosyltransferase family.
MAEALALLLVVRVVGASLAPVMDCDETFNFWEPLHYALYGRGMQTWEYSPEFGLRSWLYVLLHAPLALAAGSLVGANKIAVFMGVRVLLSFGCAIGESFFVDAVRYRFGPRVGLFTLGILFGSAGMFHAAPAFLPSSFVLVCVLVSVGAWLRDRVPLAVRRDAGDDVAMGGGGGEQSGVCRSRGCEKGGIQARSPSRGRVKSSLECLICPEEKWLSVHL